MHAQGFVLILSIITGYRIGVNCLEIIMNESLYTRNGAFTFCKAWGGSISDWEKLNSSEVGEFKVWTLDVINITYIHRCDHANATKLCGFIYLPRGKNTWNDVLFGDCQATRSYVCHDSTGTFRRINATYSEAIKCHDVLSSTEVQSLPSGYYWNPENISYCQQQHTDLTMTIDNTSSFLCGVYSRDFGHAFYDCSKQLNVVCNIGPPQTTAGVIHTPSTQDKYTRIRSSDSAGTPISPVHHNTSIKATSTGKHKGSLESTTGVVPTLSTHTRHTRTGYSGSTKKILSPIQPHTTTKESNIDKDKGSTETSFSAVPTLATGDRGIPAGGANDTKKTITPVQPHASDKESNTGEHLGIGVKIGVPIAVSIVIIIGVILAIVLIRRKHRKRSNKNEGLSRQTENQRYSKPPNDQYVNTYHTRVFENKATEKQSAVQNAVYNVQDDFEMNQQSDENNDYCAAMDFDRESEVHVYDHTSQVDEEYDTITGKGKQDQKANVTDNVYNHLGGVEKEDVYDSTHPGELQRGQESDNVYNKLPGDGSCDDTHYSGLNFNARQHRIKEENIYNTS